VGYTRRGLSRRGEVRGTDCQVLRRRYHLYLDAVGGKNSGVTNKMTEKDKGPFREVAAPSEKKEERKEKGTHCESWGLIQGSVGGARGKPRLFLVKKGRE